MSKNAQSVPFAVLQLPYRCDVRGPDGSLLRSAVDQGAKGIVVQALGMGNMNQPMFEAVKYALDKQVPVVISTRVYSGRVMANYGFEGGGKTTADAGAVMAGELSPQKARILLMLLLPKREERARRAAGRV